MQRIKNHFIEVENDTQNDEVYREHQIIISEYDEIGGFSMFKKYKEFDSVHFAYLINGTIFFALFLCPLFFIAIDTVYNIYLVFTNGINQTKWEGIFYDLFTLFWVIVFYNLFFSLINCIIYPVYSYALSFLGNIVSDIAYITIYPLALLCECVYGLLYKISGWEAFDTDYKYTYMLKRDTEWIMEWIINRKIKKEQAKRESILKNLTPEQKEGYRRILKLYDAYIDYYGKGKNLHKIAIMLKRGITFKTHYELYKYMENVNVIAFNLSEECRMKNAKNCKYANYKVRYDD